ncbi:MAG: GNAT family N-acyltransferase [Bacteroidia bacterium]|nr:lysophospholipid acyltransferase family protein [Bacteroidia bacterium]MDW8158588.1 GNAT family N-acyltransferase [Bacteroidia bacterium]
MRRNTERKVLVDTSLLISHTLPRELYRYLLQPGIERLLGIKRLNTLYENIKNLTFYDGSKEGTAALSFAESVLQSLNIRWQITQSDIALLRQLEGPVVVLANHPFGGIEAIFLFLLLEKVWSDFRIMANFMLSQIPEVKNKLILVDPFQKSDSAHKNIFALKETLGWLQKGGVLGMFPSGQVAAFDWKTGKIQEPSWSPHIGRILMSVPATVVPVYFVGHNSLFFHLAGLVHKRLRTSLLIREFVNPATSAITYQIGKPVLKEKIRSFKDPYALTQYLQSKTYLLAPKPSKKLFLPKLISSKEKKLEPIANPVAQEVIVEAINTLPSTARLYRHHEWEVWIFQANRTNPLLKEIGRLREIAYRQVGEGTGKSLDLDDYDDFYEQLFLWNCQTREIVGAYRLFTYSAQKDEPLPRHYLSTLFHIQSEFYSSLSPFLELGRSFIVPAYQKNYNALLLLWKGIGQYLKQNSQIRYLIGAVSIPNHYHPLIKDFIVYYLQQYHGQKTWSKWVVPKNPYRAQTRYGSQYYQNLAIQDLQELQNILAEIDSAEHKIPILLKHYLKLGGKILGFNIDPDFNNALDVFLVVEIENIPASIQAKFMEGE